jgi:hypothetical protein
LAGRPHTEDSRKASGRSGLSNRAELLPGIDGRSTTARRFRDLVSDMIADAGGREMVSECKLQLIRRFSASCCLAERLEAVMASGRDIDASRHCVLANTSARLAGLIGHDRIPKDSMTLDAYIRPRSSADLDDAWDGSDANAD